MKNRTSSRKAVLYLTAIIATVFAMNAHAQSSDNDLRNELAGRFLRQSLVYPQEKAYVHTDREHYLSGDTIWLRVHMVDAATHAPARISRYAYADLIDPAGNVAYNIKLICRDGVYSGYIALMNEAPAGSYTLRAYTSFMKSPGLEYSPVKRIRISDKAMLSIPATMEFSHGRNGRVKGILNMQDLRDGHSIANKDIYVTVNGTFIDMLETTSKGRLQFSARLEDPKAKNVVTVEYDYYTRFFTIPAPADDFDVSFFPEGGHLLHGAACMVGFKALRKDGSSLDISGRIVDGEGNEVAEFSSAYKGMGLFSFLPGKDKTYHAECSAPGSDTLRFDLPKVYDNTLGLEVKKVADRLWVGVSRPQDFTPALPLHIVMHSRGNLVSVLKVDDPTRKLRLNPSSLPSGVLHILLLDNDLNVLSERLTFISNDDQARATVTTDRRAYGKRQPVNVEAKVTDADGNPLTGSFSVAVTDDRTVSPDSTSNILTELLLASDLRGYIEDPAWYFDPRNHGTREALDALMLTQGWRRYDIPETLKGKIQPAKHYLEIGEEISGKVVTLWSGKPVDDAVVTMLHKSIVFLDQKETDAEGTFSFAGFEIPEGSSILLQALSEKRKKRVELIVDQLPPVPVDHAMLVHDPVADDPQQIEEAYLQKRGTDLSQLDLSGVIEIEEVTVVAKKIQRGFYSSQFLMGRSYDKKYFDKLQIERMDMLLLRLIPMLEIHHDSVAYKNRNVRIIMDNFDVDSMDIGYFMSLGTADVDYIEVARDHETVPFGWDFQGMKPLYGAVIAVYTKGGMGLLNRNDTSFNKKTISPPGFQKAVEFYSPKYETEEDKAKWTNDKRSTLYWNPDLRTGENGTATFRFWSSDMLGTTYSIVMEGVTDDGRIVRTTGSVRVE